ncbi:MAG TPA: YigZ family protein [Bacteroidales bacterium]|nr:YigZ family protein [Bacteroidales bacterium]HPF03776.1 YigZ family protein [Bacteroidales bacterium]HPR11244.1 YigZ family protein [Bacteroidales bacterium]HRW86516.1 YigZ family protein [Bacteroidales bacterium]
MSSSFTYRSISGVSEGFYKEKGSRFIAKAYPVADEDEIRIILESVRKEHHEARHHCYAYILGADSERWRANDDGEPSGTAGRPILGQIRSLDLTNVLVVVSRYFGGTLLGVSGLIKAYRNASASALKNAGITEHVVRKKYMISFPYSVMNDVMKVLKDENIAFKSQEIDLECRLSAELPVSEIERILGRLSRIEGLKYSD